MQRNRITGNSSPAPWQESVVRDRGGNSNSSGQSRALPSHSLNSRPFASRPPASPLPASRPSASNPSVSRLPASQPFASPLPASNPFASRLPVSNPFASRLPVSNSIASSLRASRPLSAPGDGSDEIQSEDDFYSASSASVSTESESLSIYSKSDEAVIDGLRGQVFAPYLELYNDGQLYGPAWKRSEWGWWGTCLSSPVGVHSSDSGAIKWHLMRERH